MLVDAVDEVLAGHAGHAALPVLQVSVIDKTPLLRQPSVAVRMHWRRSGEFFDRISIKKRWIWGDRSNGERILTLQAERDLCLGVEDHLASSLTTARQ